MTLMAPAVALLLPARDSTGTRGPVFPAFLRARRRKPAQYELNLSTLSGARRRHCANPLRLRDLPGVQCILGRPRHARSGAL